MTEIREKMLVADVIVWTSPIYFYTMTAQMEAGDIRKTDAPEQAYRRRFVLQHRYYFFDVQPDCARRAVFCGGCVVPAARDASALRRFHCSYNIWHEEESVSFQFVKKG